MREHQIVISLKSEHFQQVQRMARAAGAKSVGLFIRQRLLSALGLDGQDNSPEPEKGPDWQRISGQLRRLHRELQVFIAESITPTDPNSGAQSPLRMPEENFLTDGAPVLPGYNYDYQEAIRKEALPSASQSNPPVANKSAPAFDADTDEMEKLADRAFAISPRLGALEPIKTRAKELQDPLADLLGQSLTLDEQSAEEESTTDHDQLQEQEQEQGQGQGPQDSPEEAFIAQEQLSPAEAEDDDSGGNKRQSSDENQKRTLLPVEEEAISDEIEDNDEIDTEHDDQAPTKPPEMGSAPPPPPISGGPPPRKR